MLLVKPFRREQRTDSPSSTTKQPGGQDSQLVAPDLSTHLDANFLLQTHDHPPAFISVRTDGWRVGPRETLEKLEDPALADEVDPKSYSFRLYVHMETGDPRYLHLNTGMWVGSGIRRGTEGIFLSPLLSFLASTLRILMVAYYDMKADIFCPGPPPLVAVIYDAYRIV